MVQFTKFTILTKSKSTSTLGTLGPLGPVHHFHILSNKSFTCRENQAARMIASRVAPKLLNATKAGAAARQMSAVSGPPTVRVSAAEKLVHGVVISVSVLAMPAWVLTHIREYRGLA